MRLTVLAIKRELLKRVPIDGIIIPFTHSEILTN